MRIHGILTTNSTIQFRQTHPAVFFETQVGGCRAEAEAAPGGGFEQGDGRGAGDFATTKTSGFQVSGVVFCLYIYIHTVVNYQWYLVMIDYESITLPMTCGEFCSRSCFFNNIWYLIYAYGGWWDISVNISVARNGCYRLAISADVGEINGVDFAMDRTSVFHFQHLRMGKHKNHILYWK